MTTTTLAIIAAAVGLGLAILIFVVIAIAAVVLLGDGDSDDRLPRRRSRRVWQRINDVYREKQLAEDIETVIKGSGYEIADEVADED